VFGKRSDGTSTRIREGKIAKIRPKALEMALGVVPLAGARYGVIDGFYAAPNTAYPSFYRCLMLRVVLRLSASPSRQEEQRLTFLAMVTFAS
jgi:hypothetical protein